VLLLTKMGAIVTACGPATLVPLGLERLGVTVSQSIDAAVEGADVVMMLRVQFERMHGLFLPSLREYFTLFGLTPARLARAASDVIVMHPGPINRLDRRRRPVVGDSRTGGERTGRENGGSVPACRRGRRGFVINL
jgi:aspartate carbamoyltransferase catalytic subunit